MSDSNLTATAPNGAPGMTTPETLANIFFDPSETFTALRERPRFLVAAIILALLTTTITILIFQKADYETVMRRAMESNPRAEQMTPEQKEQAIRMQTNPVFKGLAYASPLIITVIVLTAGAALYMLGGFLMGGRMSYRQALAVWAYSSFPPAVLATILSIVMLFIKTADEIDLEKPGAGLLQSNLAVLLGPDSSPVLRALLGSFDLFSFYGLFLAAIGMRKVARLSSGSAWAVVLGLWLIYVLLKVGWAAIFG